MYNIEILNHATRKPMATLDQVISAGYTRTLNAAWTAQFELAYNDEKNASCTPFALVRMRDGTRDSGLYRIGPQELVKSGTGGITYECEHVITTLFNDTMLGFHQIGNIGTYTKTVIEYILSFQSIPHWVLGDCEFTRQFEYCWENQTLLAALWSITNPFSEPYRWEFDTSSYPWVLHLRKLDMNANPQCYARTGDGGNIRSITRRTNTENLCTYLVPLGYGEGPNQLNISALNGGSMVLEASQEAIDAYGPITLVWVDRRYTDVESLYSAGQALLDELSKPRLEYEIDAIDLFPITGDELDAFEEGKIIRVTDEKIGEDLYTIIKEVSKSDFVGKPSTVKVTIANAPEDIAGSIADLADRQRIEQLYAQGSCSPDTQNFSDNADPTHPAVLRFWVDDDAIRINKIMLVFEMDYFRGTARGVAAAAQNSTTSSTQPAQSSSEGGGTYNSNTASGGASSTQQTSGPSSTSSSNAVNFPTNTTISSETTDTVAQSGMAHRHGYVVPIGVAFNVLAHSHIIDHTHTFVIAVSAHAHTFNVAAHSHTIPGHNHQITIPSHTHAMEFGIYQGRKASSAAVYVDGQQVLMAPGETFDVSPYLAVDGGGRITRGTFHIIQIVPNDQTYINATGISYVFTSPRTGGDH